MANRREDYVVGMARLKSTNPIAQTGQTLLLGICFDSDTGEILSAELNGVLALTTRFLTDILVGHSLYTGLGDLLLEVERRCPGDSGTALAIALKDACNKVKNRKKI